MNIIDQIRYQQIAFTRRNFRKPDRLIMTFGKHLELLTTKDIERYAYMPTHTFMGMKIIVSITDIDGGFEIR